MRWPISLCQRLSVLFIAFGLALLGGTPGSATVAMAGTTGIHGVPVETSLSPASGPASGGTTVTIKGSGLVAGATTVTIGGLTVPASEVTVNASGTTAT